MWKILKKSKEFKELVLYGIVTMIIIAASAIYWHSDPVGLISSVLAVFFVIGFMIYEVEKICQKGEEEEESQE